MHGGLESNCKPSIMIFVISYVVLLRIEDKLPQFGFVYNITSFYVRVYCSAHPSCGLLDSNELPNERNEELKLLVLAIFQKAGFIIWSIWEKKKK